MTNDNIIGSSNTSNSGINNDLPPVSELEDYGAFIVKALDKAEEDLEDGDNQPFSGMTSDVMRDIAHLRNRQFDMFQRHVQIEQGYKIHGSSSSSDGNMTFANIATTMRRKEIATSALLDRLADFDSQLRQVMDKFESSSSSNLTAANSTSVNMGSHSQLHQHISSQEPDKKNDNNTSNKNGKNDSTSIKENNDVDSSATNVSSNEMKKSSTFPTSSMTADNHSPDIPPL